MAQAGLHRDIVTLAQRREPDRYYTGLFMGPRERQLYWLVSAFHGELNRILQLTREPMLAEIRLQWWRETLTRFAQPGRTGQVLADALCERLRGGELSLEPLLAMIEARSVPLAADFKEKAHELIDWAQQLEGETFTLTLSFWPPEEGPLSSQQQQVCAAAARGYGLFRCLVEAYQHHDQRSNWGEILTPLRHSEQFESEVKAAIGKARLAVKEAWEQLPIPMRTCFLPVAVIPAYFPSLGPKRGPLPYSHLRNLWRIWRAARRGL